MKYQRSLASVIVIIDDSSVPMGGCGSADDDPLAVACELVSGSSIASVVATSLDTTPVSMASGT